MGAAFANGTEREAWAEVWCDHCAHDHAITHVAESDVGTQSGADPGGCETLIGYDVNAGDVMPVEWVMPPDHLGHCLPSLMVCTRFTPCHHGRCTGDPHAEVRVELTGQVLR